MKPHCTWVSHRSQDSNGALLFEIGEMKKTTTYTLLPLKLIEQIEQNGLPKKHKDKAIRLVDLMLNKANRERLLMSEFIDLPQAYMQKVFGKYHSWFKLLRDSEVIECNDKYYQGQAKGYRINPDLLEGRFTSVNYTREGLHICSTFLHKDFVINDLSQLSVSKEKLIQLTEQHAESICILDFKVNDQIGNDFFEVFDRKFGTSRMTTLERAIEIATARGMAVIKDRNKYYLDFPDHFIEEKKRAIRFHYLKSINKLHKGIWFVHRNETNNRLDTNLTNLCDLLTKEIMVDNDLCSIDLSNSQFAIFSHLYKQSGNEMTFDFHRFQELASKGELYEQISEILGLENRREAKGLMFELFFSSHRYNPKRKAELKKHFPTVVKFIDQFKKEHGDNTFSIELQKMEAEIFIDNVYSRIKEECLFCLTKHDSVIVKRSDKERVLEIINEYFSEIGFQGKLSIEPKESISKIEVEMSPLPIPKGLLDAMTKLSARVKELQLEHAPGEKLVFNLLRAA